jgi:hypothetical protein
MDNANNPTASMAFICAMMGNVSMINEVTKTIDGAISIHFDGL